MKALKFILVLFISLFLLPFSVMADDNKNNNDNNSSTQNNEEKSKEVKVYFFRGEGCPHCAEAEAFFKSIENEYGSLFKLIDFETYNDFENKALLDKIGEIRDEDVSGVPYILIGSKSWSGYGPDYNEAIVDAIKSEYKKDVDERYDILELIDINNKPKEYKNDYLITIIILLTCLGLGFGLVVARKHTK